MAENNRIFISCVSDEFQNGSGPFAGVRTEVADYLTRADCEVKIQEQFRQRTDADTVRKVADTIRTCAAVIHLVGAQPGSTANAQAVRDYLDREPSFLHRFPDLRAALGDCADLTYTQWEAILALHHGVPLFLYRTPEGDQVQRVHLARLRLARRFPDRLIRGAKDILGQLLGDLRTILPTAPTQPRIGPPKFRNRHQAESFQGREPQLALLDAAWADGTNVLALIAWGGVGKTALLCKWIEDRFVAPDWRDADGAPLLDAYFEWSFYDQGTTAGDGDGERARTGSVGDFFEQALAFFEEPDLTSPGKGRRLAARVQQAGRCLLVLDGLEPLQEPPTGPRPGALLDPDLTDLIGLLASHNPGLLLLTSRQNLPELAVRTARHRQEELEDLGRDAAIRLLRDLQVKGSDADLAAACDKFDCHALSLTLVGRFLVQFQAGDARRVDCIGDLHEADELTHHPIRRKRHVWRVLETYAEWLARGDRDGDGPELALLRLTGLFDRPASAEALAALRAAPPIPGLTDALVGLSDRRWQALLDRLRDARLLRPRADGDQDTGGAAALDAHPLIREYFAEQLRRHLPEAHAAAHGRLFDYLCTSTPERPDDLPGLQPLYQAVRHGVLAGRAQTALDQVYRDRILRGTGNDGFYSQRKLGAISQDLGAVAAFFDEPWTRVTSAVSEPDRAWLLNEAAVLLRALGRLTEALGPMRAGLEMCVQQQDWKQAARAAGSLSELEVTLGDLPAAIRDAHVSVAHADRSGDTFVRMACRTTAADALHQAGERREAGALFAVAEGIQRERQPWFPLLYSLPGFRYCDWLLAPAERAAWRVLLSFPRAGAGAGSADFQSATGSADVQSASRGDADAAEAPPDLDPLAACDEVDQRVAKLFEWRVPSDSILDIALDHLTLARVAQWRALLTGAVATPAPARDPDQPPDPPAPALIAAVTGLHKANAAHHLPHALLTAALSHALRGDPAAARALLDEAWGIAEGGPMPLFQADVLLTRARLWLARPWADPSSRLEAEPAPSGPEAAPTGYPWPERTPALDLAEARRLIEHTGYARRLPELADAEAALRAADA